MPRSLTPLPRDPVRRVETRLKRIYRVLRVGNEKLFYLCEDDLRAVRIRGLDATAQKRLRHDIEYVQRELIRLLGATSDALSLLDLPALPDSHRWGPTLRLTRLARERLREGTAIEEEVHNRVVEFARQGRSEEFRWLARSQGVPEESLEGSACGPSGAGPGAGTKDGADHPLALPSPEGTTSGSTPARFSEGMADGLPEGRGAGDASA